jgi:hypothetical protein
MLSKNDKTDIINNRISNLEISISILNEEIEIFKKIDPVDQETINGYLVDIDLKTTKIRAIEELLRDVNLGID